MGDSISDFITIIRNASRARKETCEAQFSKMHLGIANILKAEGFIRDVREVKNEKGHKRIHITLKYVDEVPALTNIQRKSKSGCRLYYKAKEIPHELNGLGVSILTTSKGLLKDRAARRENIGGEIVCTVW